MLVDTENGVLRFVTMDMESSPSLQEIVSTFRLITKYSVEVKISVTNIIYNSTALPQLYQMEWDTHHPITDTTKVVYPLDIQLDLVRVLQALDIPPLDTCLQLDPVGLAWDIHLLLDLD